MSKSITLRRFDDMHCHLRTGEVLRKVVPFTAQYCGRAIIMPNTRPRAVLTASDALEYRQEIESMLNIECVLQEMRYESTFEPLMTIEIRDSTTPDIIKEAAHAGVVAGKVYPLGVTTNSDQGLRNFFSPSTMETFRAMQDEGMLLLLHGEIDKENTLITEREHAFLPILEDLVSHFPALKIVLEHASSRKAVDKVRELPETVAATITAHHLCLTLNDVIGAGIRPHNACMPMPKTHRDREALIDAATSGESKFFLGSDSAPHMPDKKESAQGAYGVYTAPILPQLLAQVFEEAEALSNLEAFASRFGARFYGLPLNRGFITIKKKEWTVPGDYNGVVPFKAGETLSWQLV